MVKHFWRSFIGLVFALFVFTIFSWFYIAVHWSHSGAPTTVTRWILPTEAPSIWNLVTLGHTGSFIGPVLVLLVQVWMTGGFYGTLIRANTGEISNATTFASDGFRSFGRLLLWNLLWAAVALAVLGLDTAVPAFAVGLNILIVICRFGFLFVDVALVAERDIRYAVQNGLACLLQGWLAMLPFAVVLLVMTDAGSQIAQRSNSAGLVVTAVVYVAATAWVLHMVAARYLYLSQWEERQAAQTA